MRIAVKIFAILSAIGIFVFDFDKISQAATANTIGIDVMSNLIFYYFLPIGLIVAVLFLVKLFNKNILEKIVAVILMVFSAFYGLFRIADLINNAIVGTFKDYETIYQGLIWFSQTLLLASLFLLAVGSFKPKVLKISGYILIASVILHIAAYSYLIINGGYSIKALISPSSDIFFIVGQALLLICYIGVYLKEVWRLDE